MAEHQTFSATVRETVGKGDSKSVRRAGSVPCVVYGADVEPLAIVVSSDDAKAIVDHPAILTITIDGTGRDVLVKDVQRHFLSHEIQHIDMQAISEDRPITTVVPVVARGEAAGTHHGGIMEQTGHTLRIQCLPKDLPEKIACDVSKLDVGQRILTRDLVMPEGVKSLSEPTTVMFSIHLPRAAVAAKAAS